MSKVKSKEVELGKKHGHLYPSTFTKQLIHYPGLEFQTKRLSGKILTIIDASVSNEKSNKAIKDLIRTEIREFLFFYQHYCSGGKEGHAILDRELESNTIH